MSEYNDISFTLDKTKPLDITFNVENATLEFNLSMGGGKLPSYEGEYIVTPKIEAQTLETKNKSMASDVQVLEIPYSEVSNPEGGLTVNIAYVL